MEIQINAVEAPRLIKVSEMPVGSIGKVVGASMSDLYVIHTNENGDKYICLWPNSNPPGLEVRSEKIVESFEVELLPKGTTIELKF